MRRETRRVLVALSVTKSGLGYDEQSTRLRKADGLEDTEIKGKIQSTPE
jgi:hypothetical protein